MTQQSSQHDARNLPNPENKQLNCHFIFASICYRFLMNFESHLATLLTPTPPTIGGTRVSLEPSARQRQPILSKDPQNEPHWHPKTSKMIPQDLKNHRSGVCGGMGWWGHALAYRIKFSVLEFVGFRWNSTYKRLVPIWTLVTRMASIKDQVPPCPAPRRVRVS